MATDANDPRPGDLEYTLLRKILNRLSTLSSGGTTGTMAAQNANAVAITGGTITGITDLAVADGGTGSSTQAGARTNLGLGTISTQDANAVTITGGTLAGMTSVAATAVTADAHILTSTSVNAQTGTSYTLLASDNGKVVTLNNAGGITLTVPASLGAGFSCTLIQLGAGQVTVTPSSTTVNSYGSLTKLAGQHATASLFAYAANVFNLAGALSA